MGGPFDRSSRADTAPEPSSGVKGWVTASLLVAVGALTVAVLTWGAINRMSPSSEPSADPSVHGPPPAGGYFARQPVGAWRHLDGDAECAEQVHHSSWEPRPENFLPNRTMPPIQQVRAALRTRPRSTEGGYDPRWDTWLLPRVSGNHVGTTDENIQWAACKWGLSDDLLRAVAIRESNWHQYTVYPSGRCVLTNGCGDIIERASPSSRIYCRMLARHGRDYQRDFGKGRCPKTFSLVGVSSWHDPEWGKMLDNQNGTFPFNRNSTAFALDYYGAFLRGCLEGWVRWLEHTGPYEPGRDWGCVGAWYAGDWRSEAAVEYSNKVRATMQEHLWLSPSWARHEVPCQPAWGCSRGARLSHVSRGVG